MIAAAEHNLLSRTFINPYSGAGLCTKIGGALCGAAAVEMAVRSCFDIYAILSEGNPENLQKLRYDLSADVGGAIFYGACSAIVVPGAAIIGGALFFGYSMFRGLSDGTGTEKGYWTSRVIYQLVATVSRYTLEPFWEYIIEPLATKIASIAGKILTAIPLPEHPIWIGVAALIVAVVTYRVFFVAQIVI